MPRPVQLHVMLSEEEMSSLRSLANLLGTTVSDTVRLLARTGAAAPSGAVAGVTCILFSDTDLGTSRMDAGTISVTE